MATQWFVRSCECDCLWESKAFFCICDKLTQHTSFLLYWQTYWTIYVSCCSYKNTSLPEAWNWSCFLCFLTKKTYICTSIKRFSIKVETALKFNHVCSGHVHYLISCDLSENGQGACGGYPEMHGTWTYAVDHLGFAGMGPLFCPLNIQLYWDLKSFPCS